MKAKPRLRLLGAPLQATLDRLCREHRVCGASLAILKDGVIHTAASGWANAPERIEATPDTLFQVGSVSKTFTATLAMQLVDEGRLDLEAPIRRYLPDFATADPRTPGVTIRQLLTHTSGIDGDFFPPDDGGAESYVRRMRDLGQLHDPGAYMTYCNAGWVVLQRIIEVLRKASWNDLVIDRICQPLGLTRALTHPKESLRFRMATGHVPAGKNGWAPAFTYLPLSMAGTGSVLSMSASDLLRYARAHMLGPQRRASRGSILSQASFRAMQTPQLEMPAHSRGVYTHMGLSWFIDPDPQFPKLNHDGRTSQVAFMHLLPKQRIAYVLLMSSVSETMGAALQEAIFTQIAGLPAKPKPAVPPAIGIDPARYAGLYPGPLSTMTVSAGRRGHLRMKVEIRDQPKPLRWTLRAVAPGEFVILDKPQLDLGARVLFLGEENGRPEYLRLGVRMNRRARTGRRRR